MWLSGVPCPAVECMGLVFNTIPLPFVACPQGCGMTTQLPLLHRDECAVLNAAYLQRLVWQHAVEHILKAGMP